MADRSSRPHPTDYARPMLGRAVARGGGKPMRLMPPQAFALQVLPTLFFGLHVLSRYRSITCFGLPSAAATSRHRQPRCFLSLIALYAFIVSVIAFSTGSRSMLDAP
jgi:hypothetical protein